MSGVEELDVLEPQGNAVTYLGERLEIKPLTIGQLPKFVRIARPVIDALLDANLEDMAAGGDVALVMDMIDKHSDQVFEAAALVTGRDRAWLESGDPAEFIELASTVVAVNRDFFTQKLAPLLAARARKSNGIGPTASSSSSDAVTH